MQPEFSPTDPAHNACVHAAAGTGKTWQLVTRIIRLLLAGANPATLLAVTFTRKAAAEMLERLSNRLHELAVADDARLDTLLEAIEVPPTTESRSRARALYETALLSPHPLRATTFHAFCQDVLQRFPLEAGIPPGFELLESDARVKQAAWDALFDELTSMANSKLASHMDTLFDAIGSLGNTRRALDSFLDSRIDWWAYCSGQDVPVRFATDRLTGQLDVDPAADPAGEFFSGQRRERLGRFANLLGRHNTATNTRYQALIEETLVRDLDSETRFESIQPAFLTSAGTPRNRTVTNALRTRLGEEGAALLVEMHEQLCRDILATREQMARLATWRQTVAWYHIGQRLLEHFQRLKRERRELDFSDLEWHTYCLLTRSDNAHWVQYKLDARIDHLLIDEFQDTNPTQWRLLLPLLVEIAAGGDSRQRSVFLVGDAKQSIYRFRRADAGLLHAASDWLGEHLHAGKYTLDSSRRSSPAIIDFVNRVFGQGLLHERLKDFRTHHTHLTELWGRVEVLPMVQARNGAETGTDNAGLRDPLTTPRRIGEDPRHYREGVAIAEKIREQVAGRLPVADNETVRPIAYRDILVLLRNRTHLPAYEQALREAGIPYIGGGRGTLLESLEVRDMEALLNTLIAPWNNLSLAQVLRSPLFLASDDDLALLATADQGTWFDRLCELADDMPEQHALTIAAEYLSRWHTLAGKLPVHDLLDRVYHEGDVIRRFTHGFPKPLRPRVRANLVRFLELALEVDSGRYPSLPHFLDRLQSLRERMADAPDDAPPGTGDDRIRIMTVHGAKGLEAPSVFLVDSASRPRMNQAWQALVNWPSGDSRPASFFLTGRKDRLDSSSRHALERQQHADSIEDANLLYVALTRARQYLVVSASAPSRGEDTGWYGYIAENIEHDDLADETAAWSADFGEFPQPHEEVIAAQSNPTPHPALARRIALTPAKREIAPSHQISEYAPGSGNDPDARRRGIAIHRFLELLSNESSLSRQQAITTVAREQQRETGNPELESWLEEAERTLGHRDFRPIFSPDCYVSSYNEVSVSLLEGDDVVYGIIDRAVVRDTHVDIIDYKTHPITRDVAAETSLQYSEQLSLYVRAAAQLWPHVPIRAWLLFTACNALVEVPVDESNPSA